MKSLWMAILILLGICVSAGAAKQLIANQGEFNIEMRLRENGDSDIKIAMNLSLADYTRVKGLFPNSFYFLQEFQPHRMTFDNENVSSQYSDAQSAILISMLGKGVARNRGDGNWYLEMDREMNYVSHGPGSDGLETFNFFWTGGLTGGFKFSGLIKISLPGGNRECSWDANAHRIVYRVSPPSSFFGKGKLDARIRPKEYVMTCPYKVYGLGANLKQFLGQWVCRSSFTNSGNGYLYNLKVRYQVKGYSEWSSEEWYPEMVPGQTIVSVFYPVMESKVALLKNRTPCDLIVEYQYEDSNNKLLRETQTRRITLYGVNEYVFSNLLAGENYGSWHEGHNNSPMLAAWVSRNDPVVKDFAALANKAIGGVGASSSNQNALKVLRGCYDLMRINDFTYQHPHGMGDLSVSFDPKFVQNVLIPREVIRMRSGTCIDLAILYASMVNALGLRPYLMVVPGHCFPLIRLPSGEIIGFETTGVAGGLRFGSGSFEEMLKTGTKEYYDALRDGRYFIVDLHTLWNSGISNPELDDMPPDILKRWGIRELVYSQEPEKKPTADAGVTPTETAAPTQPPVSVAPAPEEPQEPPSTPAPKTQPRLKHGPTPKGSLVDRMTLPGNFSQHRIRAAIVSAASRYGWHVVARYQDQVVLKLTKREVSANVTPVFDTREIRFYSNSRNTRRNTPFVPTRWIGNLKKGITAYLSRI